MLSGNQFIAAVTSDMRELPGFNNIRYSYDNTSAVKSYQVVNLSGPSIRFLLDVGAETWAKNIPNPIMTYIDYPTYSVINYTLPGHVLSPGRVIRQVIQRCNKVYIVTIGEGKTKYGYAKIDFCPSCPIQGLLTATINTVEGKRLFNNVDARVKNEYIRKYP
ncbi:hypothetical protein BWI96_10395 [Siphonobacter sp. SORGH_AS_0500]|nr:hypothetical protein BWI96_10395 [Siphonobacter sp. SORGH_AS_0500]